MPLSTSLAVAVNLASFLKPGAAYRLMDPEHVFGKPVAIGTCQGPTVEVPRTREFAAFVMIRGVR